ncbi:hypothetical protein BGX27_000316 [Mortierella sp. AM989]|nr:hypothetical protein BGX27_000316 [Mortierella sp. AM989]
MPPKMNFKPNVGGGRSRKKAVVAVEEEGSDHEIQMLEDGPADEGDILEDEVQAMERMEEERLSKAKFVDRDSRMIVESVSSNTSAGPRSKGKGKKEIEADDAETKMDELSLQDSPSHLEDESMDMEGYEGGQDEDMTMETEGEMLPDYADEGDELVKEIPVYLSQRLSKYLYLFQYPVRAAALPYIQGSGPSKARIKPISQLIELELPIDTNASQYNRERGEELALGMNDKALRTALDGEPDDDENRELLDKQTLVSSLIPNATNYLAGVLRNDEMHLTPFHGAVQLRPSFKYLDKIDEKQKQATKKVSDEENKELIAKQRAEQEQKAKALQVQVRSAADSEARKASGPNKARLADEESWTKLDYFDVDSTEADIIYDRMFASHVDDLECSTTVTEYLDLVSSINSLRNALTYFGRDEIPATTYSYLRKRDFMRIEKRYEVCDRITGDYCPNGYHCISRSLCKRNTNYYWTAVFGVLLLICIIGACVRRRRQKALLTSQPTVVTTDQSYAQPIYTPPGGDPNMAYQQHQYPPQAYTAPAPVYTPYGEKPVEAPATAYSPYPAPGTPGYSGAPPDAQAYAAPGPYGAPTSSPYPAPAGSSYPAPAGSPYPAPAGSPYPAPAGSPYPPASTSAPYPVPQGEAATYQPK